MELKQRAKAYFALGDFVRATRSESKNRLKLASEKIRRVQVGTIEFVCSREQIHQVENKLKGLRLCRKYLISTKNDQASS